MARALPLALIVSAVIVGARPQPASAGVCGAVGFFGGWAGRACSAVTHPDKLIKAGKSLATGHPGKAVKTVLSSGGASKALGLAALVTWVAGGAKTALSATAKVISKTTRPQLRTTWFSSTYWRVAGIAAILTLPFLFAAAIQALMRSDLALLTRAALGYLPLSLLAVSIAAPLTMLLLAASDEMSALVSSAAGDAGARFLGQTGIGFAGLSFLAHSPFLVFLVALMTAAAAITLWIEMLMREAAIYIVVLMLPLAFAALVWPARRIWAARTAELLVALILSKFAIVAVLALGAAALGHSGSGGGMLIGLVLVTLAALSPWALLRLLPLAELASGAAGHLRGEAGRVGRIYSPADEAADAAADWTGSVVSGMRRQARDVAEAGAGVGAPPEAGTAGETDGARAEVEKVAEATNAAGHGAGRVEVEEPAAEDESTGADDGGESAERAAGEAMASAATSMNGAGRAAGASTAGANGNSRATDADWRADLPPMSREDLSWDTAMLGPEMNTPGALWSGPGDGDDLQDGAAGEGANSAAAEGGGRGSAGGGGLGSTGGPGSTASSPAGSRSRDANTADDHDPRPTEQEPQEGRL